MANWRILGDPYRYDGGANDSADVRYGYRFDLENDEGGRAKLNVEVATGANDLTALEAADAVDDHLRERDIPRRLVFASDGEFYPDESCPACGEPVPFTGRPRIGPVIGGFSGARDVLVEGIEEGTCSSCGASLSRSLPRGAWQRESGPPD